MQGFCYGSVFDDDAGPGSFTIAGITCVLLEVDSIRG